MRRASRSLTGFESLTSCLTSDLLHLSGGNKGILTAMNGAGIGGQFADIYSFLKSKFIIKMEESL